MNKIRILRALAVLAVLAACEVSNPVSTCACSMAPPYDLVYGVVTAPGGAPLANAMVHFDIGPAGCGSAVVSSSEQANEAGRYRVHVAGTGSSAELCVRLVALAPPGSAWRASDTVRLTRPRPQSPRPDSVQVNLALRAP